MISAKVQLAFTDDVPAVPTPTCALSVTDGVSVSPLDSSAATLPSFGGAATLPLAGAIDVPLGGDVTLACVGDGMSASNIKLSAIQVDTLTVVP